MNILDKLLKANIITTKGKINPHALKKIPNEMKEEVFSGTSFLSYDAPIVDRINIMRRGYDYQPKCECGQSLKWVASMSKFPKHCSKTCSGKYSTTQRQKTCQEKYGVKTALENIPPQTRKENSRNGGYKTKGVLREKYGVDNAMLIPEIKEKQHQSVKDWHRKHKRSFETGTHGSQAHWDEKQIISLEDLDSIHRNHIENKIPITVLSERMGFSPSFLHKKLTVHGYTIRNFQDSLPQREFGELFGDVEMNNRSVLNGKEIDIWFPETKTGVEIDGLFWHSSTDKNDRRHLDKLILAENAGIRLIRFTDKEVMEKRDICHSIVLAAIGQSPNTIFARNCEIREVPSDEYKVFLEANHLHGYIAAKFRIGLYHGNELVYVIGVSKSRVKGGGMELYRSCPKLFTNIPGGFSRLIKRYNETFSQPLISFVDLRVFDGNGYKKTGFEFVSRSEPNYFYVDKKYYTFESRLKYQKHKLSKILPNFDPNKSEKDNMIDHGYRLYHDCGNDKYILK